MSKVRLGINGFGRIGRLVLRSSFTENAGRSTVMAINDHSKDLDYMIYMLKYDSVHGKSTLDQNHTMSNKITLAGFKAMIEKDPNRLGLIINGERIAVTKEKDPAAINWGDDGADYIMECSGQVLTQEKG